MIPPFGNVYLASRRYFVGLCVHLLPYAPPPFPHCFFVTLCQLLHSHDVPRVVRWLQSAAFPCFFPFFFLFFHLNSLVFLVSPRVSGASSLLAPFVFCRVLLRVVSAFMRLRPRDLVFLSLQVLGARLAVFVQIRHHRYKKCFSAVLWFCVLLASCPLVAVFRSLSPRILASSTAGIFERMIP